MKNPLWPLCLCDSIILNVCSKPLTLGTLIYLRKHAFNLFCYLFGISDPIAHLY
jgi:hypothetical protein